MNKGFSLRDLGKSLLPRPAKAESLAGAPALAALRPLPGMAEGKRDRDLVHFLGQVALFEELSHAELVRLARSAHERNYRDGESIYEQGAPGAALFLVRSGVVEIARRTRNGEEVPLLRLEPPASFAEQAALGVDEVRWTSARACGPVCLVALGSSDLDALGHRFPVLANKILRKLAQIIALRLQMLVEAQFFTEEGGAPSPPNDRQS